MADPAVPPAPTPSHCPACGFENPPSTLYCQDCGAKLEVPLPSYLQASPPTVPPPVSVSAPRGAASAPTPIRKPPRILSTRRQRPDFSFAFRLLRLAIYAALVALALLIFRSPANLPPPVDPMDSQTIGEIRTGLSDVAQRGSQANAPWSRLNAYLASVIAPSGSNNALAASFVRAVLTPKPGGFTFTIQKSVMGLPIYATVAYKLVVRGGRLDLEPTGAALGRLPLPAEAAPIVQRIAGDITNALSFELGILQRARVVSLAPDGVVVYFGKTRP